jgi:hypothetical protein
MPEPEISSGSVVLVGSFNPTIFQPEWYLRQNLLPRGESESAEIKLIHPQFCHFETERFIVQVSPERFAAFSKISTNSEPLRDLVLGTFFILEHTPVNGIGLNRQMHFQMESEADWHRLGDRLAPKDGWAEVLPGRPGMLSLSISAEREAPAGSKVLVKVEPSVRLKAGAYFETNEHYDAAEGGLKHAMDILREHWGESQAYAKRIACHILDWASR